MGAEGGSSWTAAGTDPAACMACLLLSGHAKGASAGHGPQPGFNLPSMLLPRLIVPAGATGAAVPLLPPGHQWLQRLLVCPGPTTRPYLSSHSGPALAWQRRQVLRVQVLMWVFYSASA